MKLTRQMIIQMTVYYESVKNRMYGSKSKEERAKNGQFFTPPNLGAKMLEKYDCTLEEFKSKTILDPTCGSGLLLAYACIAGANPKMVFGIELDPDILRIAQNELSKFGVPKYNIHWGNALNNDCYIFPESEFEQEHKGCIYSFNPDIGEVGQVSFLPIQNS